MAAGDVTVRYDEVVELGNVRIVAGKVQLDGSNPTPVPLARFGAEVVGFTLTLSGATTPGVGAAGFPYVAVGEISGTTLNVRAFANTSNTDATPIASTNSAAEVEFIALVRR